MKGTNSTLRSGFSRMLCREAKPFPTLQLASSENIVEISEVNDVSTCPISKFQEGRKTLILDIDDTLIKSFYLNAPVDGVEYRSIDIVQKGKTFPFKIVKRPGLDFFLERLSKKFNICLYTSAEKHYAKAIVEGLKLDKHVFYVFHRKHCKKVSDKIYQKDIGNLGFPMHSTLLVDVNLNPSARDLSFQLESQPHNGLLIKGFDGNPSDDELIKLVPFLEHLIIFEDIRSVSQRMIDFDQNRLDLDDYHTKLSHLQQESCYYAQKAMVEPCQALKTHHKTVFNSYLQHNCPKNYTIIQKNCISGDHREDIDDSLSTSELAVSFHSTLDRKIYR